MYKLLVLVGAIIFLSGINSAFSQEPKLATFQETAQIIIDQQISNNVTAAITLQSSSNLELRIPSEVIEKIQNKTRVLAVIVTNEEQCVLGVTPDEACIMINFSGEEIEGGIIGIQDLGREIGDSLIDDINAIFDTNAEFHSVFVHHREESKIALETSGIISGKGTVSAVYTMPREDTFSMYEKSSSILLPRVIRDSGGFYDVAQNLSKEKGAQMTFVIVPQETVTLFQLKMSVDYPDTPKAITNVDPLNFLKIEKLKRSEYFAQDFYPLNSLLKVVVLSNDPIKIDKVNTNRVPTVLRDGERFPEFTNDGWFFDSEAGTKIEATYMFGKEFEIEKNDLMFSIIPINATETPIEVPSPEPREFDFIQFIVLIGIIMAATGAIIYFLKGFRKKS